MANDRDLHAVRGVLKGDRSAMADLYHRHAGYLAATCSRYVGSDEAVMDILQTSFLKIFSSMDRFEYRGAGSLRAWMNRIVINESLKYLREECRMHSLPEGYEREPDGPEDADVSEIPETDLLEMIRALPDGYRTVFNLYVLEEKSHREIASMLGISEGTSASQLHRAKSMLASMIREYRKEHFQ